MINYLSVLRTQGSHTLNKDIQRLLEIFRLWEKFTDFGRYLETLGEIERPWEIFKDFERYLETLGDS